MAGRPRQFHRPGIPLTALFFAAWTLLWDQLTKAWIRDGLPLHRSIPVWPSCFQITSVRNEGAAWGMWAGRPVGLALFAILVLILLVVFRRRVLPRGPAGQIVLGLLAGGILGNVIDRLLFGCVTDYLDFYLGSHHWPVFNVADVAICSGVILFFLFSQLESRRAPPPPP